jgi:hypothetical protein
MERSTLLRQSSALLRIGSRRQEKEALGLGIDDQFEVIVKTEGSQIAPPCVGINQKGGLKFFPCQNGHPLRTALLYDSLSGFNHL